MHGMHFVRVIRKALLVGLLVTGLGLVGAAGTASAESTRDDVKSESGWEYDPYYVFPLTRHMEETELPLYGRVILYPIGFAIDLIQWPVGALAGLMGK